MPAHKEKVAKRLNSVQGQRSTLTKDNFELRRGSIGEKETLASHEADTTFAVRGDKGIKLALPAVETKTTDGSSGNSETISLAEDLIESPNTEDVVVFDTNTGEFRRPDSVDYQNDSIEYTDTGATNYEVEVYYMASDAGSIELYKKAPQSRGKSEERLFEAVSRIVNTRDQLQRPFKVDLNETDLQPVVPEDWTLEIRAELPYRSDFEGQNGILEVPVVLLDEDVEGLSEAVALDTVTRA